MNVKYNCDKATIISQKMSYFDIYERYFGPIRQEAKHVLELGVKKGASLRVWRDYFPNAHIYGVDNDARCTQYAGDRTSILIASQNDPKALVPFVSGKQFDVIIDDASHINKLTLASFEILFPYVKPGGLYVIEDLANSYEDLNKVVGKWDGELRRNKQAGVSLKNERSVIDNFILDHLRVMDQRKGDILNISFWSMLCFIQKVF